MKDKDLEYFKDIILKKRKKLLEELEALKENATSDQAQGVRIRRMPITWPTSEPMRRSGKRRFSGWHGKTNTWHI